MIHAYYPLYLFHDMVLKAPKRIMTYIYIISNDPTETAESLIQKNRKDKIPLCKLLRLQCIYATNIYVLVGKRVTSNEV